MAETAPKNPHYDRQQSGVIHMPNETCPECGEQTLTPPTGPEPEGVEMVCGGCQ